METWLKNIRRVIYWILPPVLLFIILHNIDLGVLRLNLQRTDVGILLAGLIFFPLTTFIGAIRWSLLVSPYNKVVIPFSYILKKYWIGLATGFVTPGGIGMDVYRILAIGRRYGNYVLNMVVVLVEKFTALFTCMLLVIMLYPFVASETSSPELATILVIAFSLMIFSLGLVLFILLFNHHAWLRGMVKAIERAVSKALRSSASRMNLLEPYDTFNLSLGQMFEPLRQPNRLPMLFLLSLAIQANSAVAAHILFSATGYEIPFLINLFLSPVFFLLFLMPITFAGIGVREASYVILYGFFSVPAETAILVGFYSLVGTLISNIIGVLFLYSNKQVKDWPA